MISPEAIDQQIEAGATDEPVVSFRTQQDTRSGASFQAVLASSFGSNMIRLEHARGMANSKTLQQEVRARSAQQPIQTPFTVL